MFEVGQQVKLKIDIEFSECGEEPVATLDAGDIGMIVRFEDSRAWVEFEYGEALLPFDILEPVE